MNINIRNGNVIDELRKIPSESVDCIVSSPPYYSLRDYSGVATYSDADIDKVKVIALSDLQEHRNRVPDLQKGRYYLTEPVFNDKEKKWFISLKYDVSEIWGGDPDCDHEWIEYSKKLHNGRGDAQNSALYSKQNNIPDAEISHNLCSKCGAWKGQLGSEPTYQMYIDHMMLVMTELKRILKKTGTLFWNMGDSYSGSGGAGGDYNTGGIREGQPKYKQEKSEIPSKSLMMMPERLVLAMIDDGWILRNKLAWFKRNAMPSSVSDRFSNKWEYVFFFTKSQKYYFDLDSIRKPLAESSIKRISQENIPSQFRSGKSFDFAETEPVNNIPKIINNMHKKYSGVYSNLTPEESEKYGSPRARNMRANTGMNNKEPYKQNNPHLMRLNANKQFFNEKGQGGNVDYNGIDSEDGNHYNEKGANPGDVLDIPTMPHKFAHFACVSDDTEVLTSEGWKNIDTLTLYDKVLTMDILSGELHFHQPYDIYRYDYDGELVLIENRYVSQFVTPNHRVLLKYVRGWDQRIVDKDWHYVSADGLQPHSGIRFPVSGKFDEIQETISDTLVELVGWIVTEGYYGKRDNGISIYQSINVNPTKIDMIRQSLDSYDVPYTFHTYTKNYAYKRNKQVKAVSGVFRIPAKYSGEIRNLIPDKKLTIDFILKLSNRQLNLLYKVLILSDGHRRSDGRDQWVQYDVEQLELFRLVALFTGKRTFLSSRKDSVFVTMRNDAQIHYSDFKDCIKKVHFKGRVWCPSLPNTNFVARRNGRIFITGNTFPETLVNPLIKAGCPPDGVVLDPFAGSGTVGVVAKKQGKSAILTEISPEYAEIIKNRLEIEASGTNMNVKFVETASISSLEEEE